MDEASLHRVVSLMVRDHTIIANRLRQLARDHDALAGTYREALDLRPADLLRSTPVERTTALLQTPPISETDPFGPDLHKDSD